MPRKVEFGKKDDGAKEDYEVTLEDDDSLPVESEIQRPSTAREYTSERLTSILEKRPGTASLAPRPAKWGAERVR